MFLAALIWLTNHADNEVHQNEIANEHDKHISTPNEGIVIAVDQFLSVIVTKWLPQNKIKIAIWINVLVILDIV